jgi:hypothetical protein
LPSLDRDHHCLHHHPPLPSLDRDRGHHRDRGHRSIPLRLVQSAGDVRASFGAEHIYIYIYIYRDHSKNTYSVNKYSSYDHISKTSRS